MVGREVDLELSDVRGLGLVGSREAEDDIGCALGELPGWTTTWAQAVPDITSRDSVIASTEKPERRVGEISCVLFTRSGRGYGVE